MWRSVEEERSRLEGDYQDRKSGLPVKESLGRRSVISQASLETPLAHHLGTPALLFAASSTRHT
jgi:hypothetical protein